MSDPGHPYLEKVLQVQEGVEEEASVLEGVSSSFSCWELELTGAAGGLERS